MKFQKLFMAISTTIALLCLASGVAGAQTPAPFTAHQLRPNVYWIEGGGGNSGVIVGDKGVIVVDAKTTASGGKELLDNIAKITPKPVTTVILTHSDGDHVNGLASFPSGITIIAHEHNKEEQQAALAAGGRGAPPADRLPTQTVSKDKENLTIDGVQLELLHWAPAHTSGDLVIYLPEQRIVFTGDIIAVQLPDPLIHLAKKGSSEGWIKTAKGMVALNSDEFVPGHGDVQTKAAMEKRLAGAEEKRAKIKALVEQGKSLDDIKAAVGDPPPSQGRDAGRGPSFPTFTEVVYQELTKKGA
jgi:glyoxylase-like metal-dependent hydrolase (beta-lactamase superfamily II)